MTSQISTPHPLSEENNSDERGMGVAAIQNNQTQTTELTYVAPYNGS